MCYRYKKHNKNKIKHNTMENIGASVSAVLTTEKKEAEVKKVVKEEDCHLMRNEMIFFLREAPGCQIHGVAEWCENSRGDIVKEADTYFLHILTGHRCETPWACIIGVAEFNEYYKEIWETLCSRIENHENIEQDMCYEKKICV